MSPIISSFCDGEATARDVTTLREHLRACPHCRSTLRAYRAAPAAAAALAPTLPLGRGLADRAHEALAGLAARFGGGGAGTDSALTQVAAAGGARGAGVAALAKVLAVCVGTVGGAAACVATGVVPIPLESEHSGPPRHERQTVPASETVPSEEAAVEQGPAAESTEPEPVDSPADHEAAAPVEPAPEPEAPSGAVEYTPPPVEAPVAAAPSPSSSAAGNPAGEFGP